MRIWKLNFHRTFSRLMKKLKLSENDYTLRNLIRIMLTVALAEAARIPTPEEPADEAWEKAADEFCLRFARTNEAELPSPEIASALVPRLRIAGTFASTTEHLYAQQAALGDSAANQRAVLESLLVTIWRDDWKARWLAGQFVEAPDSPSSTIR
jgi:hypothetical protein